MKRIRLECFLCFLTLIFASAPLSRAQLDTSGFPLKIGNKWYYSYTNRTAPSPVIRVKTIIATVAPGAYLVRETALGQDSVTIGTSIWIERNGSFYDSVYSTGGAVCLYNASLSHDTSWYYVSYGSYHVSILLDTVSIFHSESKGQIRSTYTSVNGNWMSVGDKVALGIGWYYHYDDGFVYESGFTNVYQLIALLNNGVLYGDILLTSVGKENRDVPGGFELRQNYPNPFNPTTIINYALPHRSHVTLSVYSTLGQQVAQLVNGEIDAGYHTVQFDASNLSSGVYFYRLQAGSLVDTKKLLLVK